MQGDISTGLIIGAVVIVISAITAGLSVPPFGLGFDRSTDEQVIGTTRQTTRTQSSTLLAVGSPDFTLGNNVVRMGESRHHLEIIGDNLDVLAGFLARVPSFVWQDLAITAPSFS